MILTVTLNPALDLTYRLGRLRPHDVNRVEEVAARAGGKGINVSRVLDRLGARTLATGLAGGATGSAIERDLDAAGIPAWFAPIAGESRRTVAIVEHEGPLPATGLWEPGPAVSAEEWHAFGRRYEELLGAAELVVVAGSAPPGLPGDAHAELVRGARRRGLPVLLDASGPALVAALPAGPTAIKPNARELEELTGIAVVDPASALVAAHVARGRGARHVVASLGRGGMVALGDGGAWHARPPGALRGNDTGAGDAAVAALADGMRRGRAWPELLRHAVAASAAAVLAPVAGAIDARDYDRLLDQVRIAALPERGKAAAGERDGLC